MTWEHTNIKSGQKEPGEDQDEGRGPRVGGQNTSPFEERFVCND